jgi:hypothetical protein
MVDAREQLRVAADVHALLAGLEAAAHHDVVRLSEVDLGVAVDQRLQRHGGEVVRADVLEGPLDRAPDRRADGVDDDGFRHARLLDLTDQSIVPEAGRRERPPRERPARSPR